MEKIRYALIGCGRISPNHIAAAKNNAQTLEIAAICDRDPAHMRELAEKTGLENVPFYTDYRELLEKERPTLVAVATESGSHAAVALDCIEAGCNVIVEKPLALSLADADALIAAARARGVKLCTSHQNRFNKAIRKIRSAVDDGRFGRLFHGTVEVRWNRGPQYFSQAPWRGTWAEDGGTLMNQCIHGIDLLRWMMGDDIDEVVAYTDNLNHPYIEAEDLGLALIRFKNGGYGVVEGTSNVFGKNLEENLYLFGERGMAKAGGSAANRLEQWRFADGLDDPDEVIRQFGENPPNVYGYGHTPLYADMADAILRGRAPYVDGAAGRRALELVLAIYLSAAEGRAVKLPLTDCSCAQFQGRFPTGR